MPHSEDDASIETLLDRLERERSDRQPEAAAALARQTLPDTDSVIDDPVIDRLAPFLDADDPRVRGHVASVVGSGELDPETHGPVVDRLLALLADEDWRVRQSVIAPRITTALARTLVETAATDELATLASVLVDRLDDPIAVIRKRAGETLVGREYGDPFEHPLGLVRYHPDPDELVRALVAALSDPIDDVEGRVVDGRSPRHTAGAILATIGTERPAWLEPVVDGLVDALDTSDPAVQTDVIDALAPLLSTAPRAIPEFCRACSRLVGDAGLWDRDHHPTVWTADTAEWRRRVLTVADRPLETTPEAGVQVVATLAYGLGDTADNVRIAAGRTAIRVAQMAPSIAPDPFYTLAASASEVTGECATEPLAVLTTAHPRFVAGRLRYCLDRTFDAPRPSRSSGQAALFRAVADTNPDAVRPVLTQLVAYSTADDPGVRQGAAWTIGQTVVAAPELGRSIGPALIDGPATTAPIRSGVSRAIEAIVDVDPAIVAPAGSVLVETLTTPVESASGDDRHRTRAARIYAARALAALATARPEAVPDWSQAFVDPWHTGAFALDTSGLRGASAPEPLFILAETAPDAAAERFAALFRAVGADDPVGDPADFRLPFIGAEPERATAAADVLASLFDHDDPVVRTRALREARIAANGSTDAATRLVEPLAQRLSDLDADRARRIVRMFESLACDEQRPELLTPVCSQLFDYAFKSGDSAIVARIVEAIGAVDPDRVRVAAAAHGGPDALPPRLRTAVVDVFRETDS